MWPTPAHAASSDLLLTCAIQLARFTDRASWPVDNSA